MKYKEGERVKIKKAYLHKEIADKEVIIDHIDNYHGEDAYFIASKDGSTFYEVDDDNIEMSVAFLSEPKFKMAKELTKIVNKKCQDCGKRVSILCNETAMIVAIRCPECVLEFNKKNIK